MPRTKRVATGLKADLIASATGKGKEPEWNMLVPPSRLELSKALSWYGGGKFKPDQFKEFAMGWAVKNRPDLVELFEAARPFKFRTFGTLMRMHTRGMQWDEKIHAQVSEFIKSLSAAPQVDDELDEDGNLILTETKSKPKRKRVNPNLQAFDDELDEIMKSWNPKTGINFKVDTAHDVAPIIKRCNDMLDHFKEEGIQQYPLHMKVWLKAVVEKLSGIQKIVTTRTPRKARTRKINPVKMTQKVKYLKNDPTLKIDSRSPVDMVGKQKIYIYDTKYKKLTKLVCANASGFVIKGTTVQNFDPEKSAVAFIKKPQAELKALMGVRELDRVMNSTKSKRTAEPKGRINEFCLILNTI